MTADLIRLLGFVGVGAAVGALYFAGLWLTVRRVHRQARPVAWLLASTVVRLAVLIGAFQLATSGRWDGLLACLLGFAAIRTYWLRRMRPSRPMAAGASEGR